MLINKYDDDVVKYDTYKYAPAIGWCDILQKIYEYLYKFKSNKKWIKAIDSSAYYLQLRTWNWNLWKTHVDEIDSVINKWWTLIDVQKQPSFHVKQQTGLYFTWCTSVHYLQQTKYVQCKINFPFSFIIMPTCDQSRRFIYDILLLHTI